MKEILRWNGKGYKEEINISQIKLGRSLYFISERNKLHIFLFLFFVVSWVVGSTITNDDVLIS